MTKDQIHEAYTRGEIDEDSARIALQEIGFSAA